MKTKKIVDVKKKQNPKLMQRQLSDGRVSLYLEYYLGRMQWEENGKTKVKHNRRKETLGLYLEPNTRNPIIKKANEQALEQAIIIQGERQKELLKNDKGYDHIKPKNVNMLDVFQTYLNQYTKKDVRMISGAMSRFKDFLQIHYPKYSNSLKPKDITKDMVIQFVDYLESRSKGEGAHSYYQRFKKFINWCIDHDILLKNPCKNITCTIDENAIKKDILSTDEMVKLIQTTYPGQNQTTRKAFIFCLFTGMRFCDVKTLKYSNVDYSNKLLKYEQHKTKGHSKNSNVVVPLRDDIISLIGEPPINEAGEFSDSLIFDLPSATMCNKALKRWTKRAGINKHITWHSARHSMAVNVLNNGANIKTVADLLGHSSLKHTEKYTRAVDSLKQDAINSLPTIL